MAQFPDTSTWEYSSFYTITDSIEEVFELLWQELSDKFYVLEQHPNPPFEFKFRI